MKHKPPKPRFDDVLDSDRKLALFLQKDLLAQVCNQIRTEKSNSSWQPIAAKHWLTTVATISRWAAGKVPMPLPAFVKMIAAISTAGLLDALGRTAAYSQTLKGVPKDSVAQKDKARAKVTRRATAIATKRAAARLR